MTEWSYTTLCENWRFWFKYKDFKGVKGSLKEKTKTNLKVYSEENTETPFCCHFSHTPLNNLEKLKLGHFLPKGLNLYFAKILVLKNPNEGSCIIWVFFPFNVILQCRKRFAIFLRVHMLLLSWYLPPPPNLQLTLHPYQTESFYRQQKKISVLEALLVLAHDNIINWLNFTNSEERRSANKDPLWRSSKGSLFRNKTFKLNVLSSFNGLRSMLLPSGILIASLCPLKTQGVSKIISSLQL